MKTPIKLAVVEDHQLLRRGLVSLFEEFDELKVVIQASNGKELIEMMAKRKPDVVLLDVQMPIMDGFEVTEYLKKNHPTIKILILTMHDDEDIIRYLIRAGAHGFLLKNDEVETVVDAIYSVFESGYYYNSNVSKPMVKKMTNITKAKPGYNAIHLTEREIEVIKLISRGYTNKEIAQELCIKLRTVDGHREQILYKTKARNTAGMVMYAIRNYLTAVIKNKKQPFSSTSL